MGMDLSLKCDYSELAESYDRYRDLSPDALEDWLAVLIRWGRLSPGMRILDIGCGTGRLTIPLQQLTGAEVFGLDLSREMLDQAKRKAGAEALHWVLGDAQALPFPGKSFDFAFMCLVLHHLEDKARALAEMARVLVPGGRGLIWTVSHQQIAAHPLNEFFPSLAELDLKRFPPIATIKALMEAAGFATIQVEPIAFQERLPLSRYIEKVRNKYISTLSLLSQEEFSTGLARLERVLPERFGHELVRSQQFTIVVGERSDI
ncbi:MAG: class I SAM-dependent methyltransferase [Candidatus Bipolaricaulia bacterium]